MASLSNCLGGRYVPGIEVSYPVRQPDMYDTDWRTSGDRARSGSSTSR